MTEAGITPRLDGGLHLAVIMERKVLANKWADFQWEAVGVIPDGGLGAEPRCLYEDEQRAQWLHAGGDSRLGGGVRGSSLQARSQE